MDRLEFLRNMVIMASADGSFTQAEIELLCSRCADWGIEDPEFAETLRAAVNAHPRPEISIPTDRQEQLDLLGELIRVMAADGVLAENEKRVFSVVTAKMGISDDELNGLIDRVLADR